MIRVFVADAHPIIFKGIKAVFRNSTEISIVAKGIHYTELVNFLRTKKVSVVLLELNLPGFDFIQMLEKLKERFPKVKFLVFSALEEELYAVSALKAGASGYLSKSNPLSHLREAILKISSGGVYITNELAATIAFSETNQNPRAVFDKLSPREVQVLRLISKGKRNKDIAATLDINEKTVSTYRSRLMKKMGVKSLVQLIEKTQHIDLDLY